MDQLKGILGALVELIEKLVGDNESLKGIIDTVKQILGKLDATEEPAA
ncbi:MAG: hypothetical protein IKR49_00600 [Clostridia bacterium]|jgi:hypothetical protein|nr:hypothetical protein [Clostridia bacterium]